MLGARDLRAFCRPPMGVAVACAGVSTYPDGQPVCGLFDAIVTDALGFQGTAGVQSSAPQLRLPFNAFTPMPSSGDTVTVTDEGLLTEYEVSAPTAEGDGAFVMYALHPTGNTVAVLSASAATGQSVSSDVLDAVVAALGGNAQGAWRCRFRPFTAPELPADNVLPESGTADYDGATDDLERPFRFMVRHLAMAGDAADKLADARYVRASRLLAADPTLGGLVRYLHEISAKWEFEEQAEQIVALVVTYEVQFSTSRRDPSVPGY